MSHLLKLTEWQTITGKWYTGDVSDLAAGSNNWWLIPRMLNVPLTDYILLLKDKFHANNFYYNMKQNFLTWDWPTRKECHNFTLYVNKEARKRKFFV